MPPTLIQTISRRPSGYGGDDDHGQPGTGLEYSSGDRHGVVAQAPGLDVHSGHIFRKHFEKRPPSTSIALAHHLSLRCENDMAFVAVLYRDALPEIVAAFLEVAHLMKARALHLRPRLGGGGTVDLVSGLASGGASDACGLGSRTGCENDERSRRKECHFFVVTSLGLSVGSLVSVSAPIDHHVRLTDRLACKTIKSNDIGVGSAAIGPENTYSHTANPPAADLWGVRFKTVLGDRLPERVGGGDRCGGLDDAPPPKKRGRPKRS